MILNNNRITSIMLYDKRTNAPVAVITDNKIECDKNIEVVIAPHTGEIKDTAIAKIGDILYYENTPEELYVVASADDRFFLLYRAMLDESKKLFSFDQEHWRAYPNNKYIATLKDYGLRNIRDDEFDDEGGENE